MQKRGWVYLNKPCDNAYCILASKQSLEEFEAELLRRFLRRQEKVRMIQIRSEEKEKERISYIPGLVSLKPSNRISFLQRDKARKLERTKKEIKRQKLERTKEMKKNKLTRKPKHKEKHIMKYELDHVLFDESENESE